ncbi:arginine decarboxylase [Malonomonas rubra DSM 5091]|uniref:Arginine decarboxylase n=1 Tax=Malonomonas rubra DSM 5091 TaxID=1122189 RepID=A0A1M6J8K5_MALRU|nr:biosynthetic arginine decarboxylase [Malonomonas rubra]SHJ43015.1 arginine decarboxylase [Malonomonas rubra DSM 5091]
MKQGNKTNWTVADSAELYGIKHWGADSFTLSDDGRVTIQAEFPQGPVAVSLSEIVAGAKARGHDCPLLLRIENLLAARVRLLNDSFATAIKHTGYKNRYKGVFPVKVNQQAEVIHEICRFGKEYNHGLEAGSKAELLLALANLNKDSLLICNGYKDREFIDLGLLSRKLGIDCIFVIESPSELPIIIERSRAFNIKPLIGLRIKVSAKVGGLWTETSGDRSSFGLSTAQLVEVVDQLRKEQMLDCLQLLHCHLGSQIPDIEEIGAGVREAARFYTDLSREGVPLRYLDLGGGLAVDYIGNQTKHSHSRNYNLNDYCRTIVETVAEVTDAKQVAHPIIVTESGRATVAHTTLLLFNILDVLQFEPLSLPQQCPDNMPELVAEQFDLYLQSEQPSVATYQQALRNRDTIRNLFRRGDIDLRQRSLSENLFLAIARRTLDWLDSNPTEESKLPQLRHLMADIYYGNFSVFQSLPDTWAIGQVYPVMPIERLDEVPCRDAIISDLTCDCDGRLAGFIIGNGESPTLPLHNLKDGEEYILGVFLIGAYQETLGDLHNLFGDTNVLSVKINQNGSFDVVREVPADSIADVLQITEHSPQQLFEKLRVRAEAAVRRGDIDLTERQQLLGEFSARLQGSTYFNRDAGGEK